LSRVYTIWESNDCFECANQIEIIKRRYDLVVRCRKYVSPVMFRRVCLRFEPMWCGNCGNHLEVKFIEKRREGVGSGIGYFDIWTIICKKEGKFKEKLKSKYYEKYKVFPSCSLWRPIDGK